MLDHDEKVHGKRLTQEERMAIPALYVALGSKEKVAHSLGCDPTTVQRWLDNLTGEQWDHIQEEQRKILLQKSVDILYQCLNLVPEKLAAATLRDILGGIKIIRESLASWGGVGASQQRTAESLTDLESMLAAADRKRQQEAIQKALATGDLEPLRAYAPTPRPESMQAVSNPQVEVETDLEVAVEA